MRTLLWIPLALSVACMGCVSVRGAVLTTSSKNYIGCVRHVVLFKFKETATPDQVHAVENAFRELPHKIPGILDYEWGTNISPENKSEGYTHCFFLTFKDEAARDAYLPHPAHKEFGALLRPFLDKVLVIDYKAQE